MLSSVKVFTDVIVILLSRNYASAASAIVAAMFAGKAPVTSPTQPRPALRQPRLASSSKP